MPFAFFAAGFFLDAGLDMAEGFAFAALGEHDEQLLELARGVGVDLAGRLSAQEIFERMATRVVLALIDLACRDTVAEHFGEIAIGHFDTGTAFCYRIIVVPILEMVAVSPLVVHPCAGMSVGGALSLVRASSAEKEAGAGEKLGRAVFGEVMCEPLPKDAASRGMRDHAVTVLRDDPKMLDRMTHDHSPVMPVMARMRA